MGNQLSWQSVCMACKRSPVRIRYSPPNESHLSWDLLFAMFIVYILYSLSADKYYIGSCEDLSQRIHQHNTGRNSSTKYGLPWEIKHTEKFETRSAALHREQEIKKKKSRKYIVWLISSVGQSVPNAFGKVTGSNPVFST